MCQLTRFSWNMRKFNIKRKFRLTCNDEEIDTPFYSKCYMCLHFLNWNRHTYIGNYQVVLDILYKNSVLNTQITVYLNDVWLISHSFVVSWRENTHIIIIFSLRNWCVVVQTIPNDFNNAVRKKEARMILHHTNPDTSATNI